MSFLLKEFDPFKSGFGGLVSAKHLANPGQQHNTKLILHFICATEALSCAIMPQLGLISGLAQAVQKKNGINLAIWTVRGLLIRVVRSYIDPHTWVSFPTTTCLILGSIFSTLTRGHLYQKIKDQNKEKRVLVLFHPK